MATNYVDILKRDEYIKEISDFIISSFSISDSKTLAVDGSWGCGKSFIINKVKEKFEKKNEYLAFVYDAWDNDYNEEPLASLLYKTIETINNKTFKERIVKELTKKVFQIFIDTLSSLAGQLSKKVTGIDFVKEGKKCYKNIKRFAEDSKIDTSFFKNSGVEGAKNMAVIALKYLSRRFKLVFFIDEIDRCIPEYGMKVLERLHHLSCSEINCCFVVCTNMKALKGIIPSLYSMDEKEAGGYFTKFFDETIFVHEGSLTKNISERCPEYFTLFKEDEFTKGVELFWFFRECFDGVLIRDVIKLLDKALIIHKKTDKNNEFNNERIMLAEIICVICCYYNEGEEKPLLNEFSGYTAPTTFAQFYNVKHFKTLSKKFINEGGSILQTTGFVQYVLNVNNLLAYLWYFVIACSGVETSNKYSFEPKTISKQILEKEYKYLGCYLNNCIIYRY